MYFIVNKKSKYKNVKSKCKCVCVLKCFYKLTKERELKKHGCTHQRSPSERGRNFEIPTEVELVPGVNIFLNFYWWKICNGR